MRVGESAAQSAPLVGGEVGSDWGLLAHLTSPFCSCRPSERQARERGPLTSLRYGGSSHCAVSRLRETRSHYLLPHVATQTSFSSQNHLGPGSSTRWCQGGWRLDSQPPSQPPHPAPSQTPPSPPQPPPSRRWACRLHLREGATLRRRERGEGLPTARRDELCPFRFPLPLGLGSRAGDLPWKWTMSEQLLQPGKARTAGRSLAGTELRTGRLREAANEGRTEAHHGSPENLRSPLPATAFPRCPRAPRASGPRGTGVSASDMAGAGRARGGSGPALMDLEFLRACLRRCVLHRVELSCCSRRKCGFFPECSS